MTDWTVVGFTGHRNLGDPETAARAIRALLKRLSTDHGPLAVASSAASGADTLFLEEAERCELPLFLVLPFSVERFREDFEPNDWARVPAQLERALHVDVVGETESVTEAYMESGIRVVDQADVLIALWNGKPAGGEGGTADVVSYARRLGKPVITIDPDSAATAEERIEQLRAASAPAAVDTRESVAQCFEKLDRDATREGPRTRHFVLQVILIHLGAAAVGLLPAVLGWHDLPLQIALGIEVVALVLALALTFPQRHAHDAWIRTRFEAEMCRSFLAIWNLTRRIGQLPRFAYPWSRRLYRNLRIAWYLDRKAALSLSDARDRYLKTRVQDQADYFRKNYSRATRRVLALKRSAQTATVGAILMGLVALGLSVFSRSKPPGVYLSAKLLALLLPLVNAAALSIMVANDLGRRATRYRQMADVLDSAAERLETTQTWPGLWRIVTETEEVLLQEVSEWQTVTQVTGESHGP